MLSSGFKGLQKAFKKASKGLSEGFQRAFKELSNGLSKGFKGLQIRKQMFYSKQKIP